MLYGWALAVLHEAGAIRQCEEHGWMQDRADPHAREHAVSIARQYPPTDISPEQAVAEIRDMLDFDRRHLPGVSARLVRR